MRVVLDTNVFVSGIFFGGKPGRLLELWRDGHFELVTTRAIHGEYSETAAAMHARYPQTDPAPFLDGVRRLALFLVPFALSEPVCADPDDDMFVAAALVSGAGTIVCSGDAHLLAVSGFRGICVLKPAQLLALLVEQRAGPQR